MKNLVKFGLVIGIVAAVVFVAVRSMRNPMIEDRIKTATAVENVTLSSLANSSAASSSESLSETKTVTLVDQDYPTTTAKGRDWLKAIGTVKLVGNLESASLHITVSRGGNNKGWSAVGIYAAPFDANGWPNESVYGTRLAFIDAHWNGDCLRHLADDSSFGVLHEHNASTVVNFLSVPVTSGSNGCNDGQEVRDLLNDVKTGLYLGFAPSSPGYHIKAELTYTGDLTITSL